MKEEIKREYTQLKPLTALYLEVECSIVEHFQVALWDWFDKKLDEYGNLRANQAIKDAIEICDKELIKDLKLSEIFDADEYKASVQLGHPEGRYSFMINKIKSELQKLEKK